MRRKIQGKFNGFVAGVKSGESFDIDKFSQHLSEGKDSAWNSFDNLIKTYQLEIVRKILKQNKENGPVKAKIWSRLLSDNGALLNIIKSSNQNIKQINQINNFFENIIKSKENPLDENRIKKLSKYAEKINNDNVNVAGKIKKYLNKKVNKDIAQKRNNPELKDLKEGHENSKSKIKASHMSEYKTFDEALRYIDQGVGGLTNIKRLVRDDENSSAKFIELTQNLKFINFLDNDNNYKTYKSKIYELFDKIYHYLTKNNDKQLSEWDKKTFASLADNLRKDELSNYLRSKAGLPMDGKDSVPPMNKKKFKSYATSAASSVASTARNAAKSLRNKIKKEIKSKNLDEAIENQNFYDARQLIKNKKRSLETFEKFINNRNLIQMIPSFDGKKLSELENFFRRIDKHLTEQDYEYLKNFKDLDSVKSTRITSYINKMITNRALIMENNDKGKYLSYYLDIYLKDFHTLALAKFLQNKTLETKIDNDNVKKSLSKIINSIRTEDELDDFIELVELLSEELSIYDNLKLEDIIENLRQEIDNKKELKLENRSINIDELLKRSKYFLSYQREIYSDNFKNFIENPSKEASSVTQRSIRSVRNFISRASSKATSKSSQNLEVEKGNFDTALKYVKSYKINLYDHVDFLDEFAEKQLDKSNIEEFLKKALPIALESEIEQEKFLRYINDKASDKKSLKEKNSSSKTESKNRLSSLYIPGSTKYLKNTIKEIFNKVVNIESYINQADDKKVLHYIKNIKKNNIDIFNAKINTKGDCKNLLDLVADKLKEPGVYKKTKSYEKIIKILFKSLDKLNERGSLVNARKNISSIYDKIQILGLTDINDIFTAEKNKLQRKINEIDYNKNLNMLEKGLEKYDKDHKNIKILKNYLEEQSYDYDNQNYIYEFASYGEVPEIIEEFNKEFDRANKELEAKNKNLLDAEQKYKEFKLNNFDSTKLSDSERKNYEIHQAFIQAKTEMINELEKKIKDNLYSKKDNLELHKLKNHLIEAQENLDEIKLQYSKLDTKNTGEISRFNELQKNISESQKNIDKIKRTSGFKISNLSKISDKFGALRLLFKKIMLDPNLNKIKPPHKYSAIMLGEDIDKKLNFYKKEEYKSLDENKLKNKLEKLDYKNLSIESVIFGLNYWLEQNNYDFSYEKILDLEKTECDPIFEQKEKAISKMLECKNKASILHEELYGEIMPNSDLNKLKLKLEQNKEELQNLQELKQNKYKSKKQMHVLEGAKLKEKQSNNSILEVTKKGDLDALAKLLTSDDEISLCTLDKDQKLPINYLFKAIKEDNLSKNGAAFKLKPSNEDLDNSYFAKEEESLNGKKEYKKARKDIRDSHKFYVEILVKEMMLKMYQEDKNILRQVIPNIKNDLSITFRRLRGKSHMVDLNQILLDVAEARLNDNFTNQEKDDLKEFLGSKFNKKIENMYKNIEHKREKISDASSKVPNSDIPPGGSKSRNSLSLETSRLIS